MFSNLVKAFNAYLVLEQSEDETSEKIMELCDNVFFENETEITNCLKKFTSKLEL